MDRENRFNTKWALAAITMIGLVLRLTLLSKESFWLDEAASAWISGASWDRALRAEATNPPLYYILLYLWIRCFGSSEAAIRALSVVPSVILIPVLYGLGKRLVSARVGIFAAAILALSPFHIAYAQEARTFALLSLFLVLAASSCWTLLADEKGLRAPKPIVAYLAWAIISLYTHFIAVFFIAAHNLYFVVRNHRGLFRNADTLRWALVQLTVICLYLPWLFKMLRAAASGGGQSRRHMLLKVPQTFFSFLFGDTLVPLDEVAVSDIVGTLTANWPLLLAATVAAAAVAAASAKQLKAQPQAALFLGTMTLVPLILAFVVSIRIPFFDERYLIGCSPFLYLLCAWGISSECAKRAAGASGTAFQLTVSLPAVLVLASIFNYFFHPRFGKEQWREAVAYVEADLRAGDPILLDADFMNYPVEYYARKQPRLIQLFPEAREPESEQWRAVKEQLNGHPRIWLMQSHHRDDLFFERLSALYQLKSRRWYKKDKGIFVAEFTTRP